MNNNQPSWVQLLDPEFQKKPGKESTSGPDDCHTPLNEQGNDYPFIIQTNGAVQVKREVILKAMQESGFVRTKSCCDPELKKMCGGDEYKGNLEGFVNRLMKLISVSPST